MLSGLMLLLCSFILISRVVTRQYKLVLSNERGFPCYYPDKNIRKLVPFDTKMSELYEPCCEKTVLPGFRPGSN